MNLINKAFNDSIISDEAVGIAKDFSEIALDSILKDGLLKDIPIVGTLISLGKITYNLKDRQTFKKIAIFLSKLEDVSQVDREKFAQKLDEEDQFKETVSEKVLLLLERLDETAKAEIVANLFKLYMLGFIDKESFLRYCRIVEQAFYNDLCALSKTSIFFPDFQNNELHPPNSAFIGLSSLGIYTSRFGEKGSLGLAYKKTDIGVNLANLMYFDLHDSNFIAYLSSLSPK